jgi:hypothetical protein
MSSIHREILKFNHETIKLNQNTAMAKNRIEPNIPNSSDPKE